MKKLANVIVIHHVNLYIWEFDCRTIFLQVARDVLKIIYDGFFLEH